MKKLTLNKLGFIQVAIDFLRNLISNEVSRSFALGVGKTNYHKPCHQLSKLQFIFSTQELIITKVIKSDLL